MKSTCLTSLALAGLLASGAASAQFFGTVGYTSVNPDSDNGSLAGADASVSDDWNLTGSLGYRFTPNAFAELNTALVAYEHDVSLDGLGTVASVEHRPTILSINYQFLAESKVRPFIRLGYGWVALSGEQSKGALAGLEVTAGDSSGLVYGGGKELWGEPGRFQFHSANLTQARDNYDDAGIEGLLRFGRTHDGHRPLGMPVMMLELLSDREIRDITA